MRPARLVRHHHSILHDLRKVFQDLTGTAREVLTPIVGMDHWSGDQRDNVPIAGGEMGGLALKVTGTSVVVGALGIATASMTASPSLVTKVY